MKESPLVLPVTGGTFQLHRSSPHSDEFISHETRLYVTVSLSSFGSFIMDQKVMNNNNLGGHFFIPLLLGQCRVAEIVVNIEDQTWT